MARRAVTADRGPGPVTRPALARDRPARPVPGVLVGAAMAAVAVVADPSGLRPFGAAKWWSVAVLVLAALAVEVRRRRPFEVDLPRWFGGGWVVLLASMALATLGALDPVTAILGHPQRHLGLLAWLIFGACGLLGVLLGGPSSAPGQRAIAVGAAVATVALGSTALVDLAGWDPLGTSFAGGRVGGFVGQPTTMAAAAVLFAPLASRAPLPRLVRWSLVAAAAGVVVATQTRGAVAGGVVAAVMCAPALSEGGRGRVGRPRVTPVAVGLLAVLAVLAVLASTPLGARLADTLDSSRPDEWAVAGRVIVDRPGFGAGPEGYRIAVLEHLDDGYVDAHGREVVIDRAHSAPLDVAATGGVLAGGAYVVLAGGTAAATWRLRRRSPRSFATAAGAGATGYFATTLFAFPVPSLDAIAWVLAGTAVAAAATGPGLAISVRGRRMALAATAALLAVVAIAGTTELAADRHLATAVAHADRGSIDAGVDAAARATDLRPDQVDSWYVAARVAARGETILDLDRAIVLVADGIDRFPRDPALADLHVELLTERAVRSGLEADRSAALAAAGALEAVDPTSTVADAARQSLRQP